MIQLQLEEDGRGDEGPQQLGSGQALVVGTDTEEREEMRDEGGRNTATGSLFLFFFFFKTLHTSKIHSTLLCKQVHPKSLSPI